MCSLKLSLPFWWSSFNNPQMVRLPWVGVFFALSEPSSSEWSLGGCLRRRFWCEMNGIGPGFAIALKRGVCSSFLVEELLWLWIWRENCNLGGWNFNWSGSFGFVLVNAWCFGVILRFVIEGFCRVFVVFLRVLAEFWRWFAVFGLWEFEFANVC
jgi:hypothetical protein